MMKSMKGGKLRRMLGAFKGGLPPGGMPPGGLPPGFGGR
jgi:hypothetical protein